MVHLNNCNSFPKIGVWGVSHESDMLTLMESHVAVKVLITYSNIHSTRKMPLTLHYTKWQPHKVYQSYIFNRLRF